MDVTFPEFEFVDAAVLDAQKRKRPDRKIGLPTRSSSASAISCWPDPVRI